MKILVLILLTVTLSFSDNFDIGANAYSSKNYIKAIKYWAKDADKGKASSAYNLALLYKLKVDNFMNILSTDKSFDVIQISEEKAYALSLKYFEIAFNRGIDNASNQLGLLYTTGVVYPIGDTVYVQPSGKKAKHWFNIASKSTKQKVASFGELQLGELYFIGKIVLEDYPLALKHYKNALALGKTRVQCFIGEIYLSQGKREEAKKILRAGSENGHGFCSTLWKKNNLGKY